MHCNDVFHWKFPSFVLITLQLKYVRYWNEIFDIFCFQDFRDNQSHILPSRIATLMCVVQIFILLTSIHFVRTSKAMASRKQIIIVKCRVYCWVSCVYTYLALYIPNRIIEIIFSSSLEFKDHVFKRAFPTASTDSCLFVS